MHVDLITLIYSNKWQLFMFLLYIVFIILFSIIYYIIYHRNKQNFLFNADIIESQTRTVRSDIENRINFLKKKIEVLDAFFFYINNEKDIEWELNSILGGYETVFTIPEYKIVFESSINPALGGDIIVQLAKMRVYDSHGNIIMQLVRDIRPGWSFDWTMSSLKKLANYREIAANLIAESKPKALSDIQKYEQLLSDNSPLIWSYFDFLYFSIITQTTVGYGDILPNSTKIRKLVSLQVLIGLLILGVIINLVIQKPPT